MTETTISRNTVHDAVAYLASVCDWAQTEDGQGFNGTDTGLGHFLATLPRDQWTAEMEATGYEMVRKYRGQLAGVGIDFDAIERPPLLITDSPYAARNVRNAAQEQRTRINARRKAEEAREREAAAYIIDLDGRELTVTTPRFIPELVETLRAIPTRRWDGRSNRFDSSRAEVAAALAPVIEEYRFNVTEAAQAALDRIGADAQKLRALPAARIEFAARDEFMGADTFVIVSPKNWDLITAIKGDLDGRRWDPDAQVWKVPLRGVNATPLADIAKRFDLTLLPEAQERLDRLTVAARKEAADLEFRGRASDAKDADLEMPDDFGFDLFPFQRAGVAYALNARRTFIADDMGTGKTIQALAAIRREEAFPAVIVTPAAVKLKWLSEARKALPGKRCVALSGRAAKLETVLNADVIILNWDILAYWAGTKGKARGRNKAPDKPGVLTRIDAQAAIFDESHYGKEDGAQRTRAALMLSDAVFSDHGDDALLLNLTGSPVLNRPKELITQLQIIRRLEDFGGFMPFAKRYCAAYKDRMTGYWDFSGSSNEDELNRKLRAICMVRRLKKDVLAELPAKTFTRIPAALTNQREYQKAERDVIAWLQDNVESDAEFAASLAGLDDSERKLRIAARRTEVSKGAEKAEELVRLNALRRIAALGLVKPGLEWIKDFLESSDEKLVVFAYHRDVQQQLLAGVREMGYSATSIFGGEHGKGNDKAFQTDPSIRVVVASLTAAREGIDLFAASNTLMVERNWSPKTEEQAEDRTHRIGQTADAATYWYLHPEAPEDNIYDWMAELLEQKRSVATAITDGEAQKRTMGESVVGGVIKRALAKAA